MNCKLQRLVLRFLAWRAYETYIKAETCLSHTKAAHRKSTERMVKSLRRVKEARRIHESFRDRLTQNNVLTVSGGLEKTNGQ